MIRRMFTLLLPVVLAFFLTTVVSAQDAKTDVKKEVKKEAKMEKKAEMKATLHSVECAPECGFMVRSEDPKEINTIVIAHSKNVHQKDVTEADVKGMMKTKKHSTEMKHEESKEEHPHEMK